MDCAINVLKCGFLWHVLQLRSGWWHRQSDTERVACLHEKCLRLEAGGDVSLFHTVLESVFHLNTDRYTETGRDRRRSQTVFKLGLRRNAARVVWPGLWCWTLIAARITLAVFVFCVDPVTPVGAWHTYAGGLVICAAVQSQQVRLSLDKLSEVTQKKCGGVPPLPPFVSFIALIPINVLLFLSQESMHTITIVFTEPPYLCFNPVHTSVEKNFFWHCLWQLR